MRRGVWLGILAAMATTAQAQEGFQEWAADQRQEFQAFREARDREFHQFLQARWEAFRVYRGEAQDPAPKPETVPQAPATGKAEP